MTVSKLITDQQIAEKFLSPEELKIWNKIINCYVKFHYESLCLDGTYTSEELRIILKVFNAWKDCS